MKQGWQLDREWKNVTKGRRALSGTVVASAWKSKSARNEEEGGLKDGAELENTPSACMLCGEDYRTPVVTRCGHYFCDECAVKWYRKDPTCATCGTDTKGVFNTASRLPRLLDRKRD